jgi:16S rRNA processing protein RimM
VVLRPHGVKGEVAVRPETDNPDRFRTGTRFLAGDRELHVTAARPHGGRWLVRFRDIDSREAADGIREAVLEIPADEARALVADEFWPEDLIGREVFQTGVRVGVVQAVMSAPAHDLLEVAVDGGGVALVPFVAALVTVSPAGLDVADLPGLLGQREEG